MNESDLSNIRPNTTYLGRTNGSYTYRNIDEA